MSWGKKHKKKVTASNLIKFFLFQENCYQNEIAAEILKNVNASSDICLPPKAKVILIVIDALKYDFGVFNPGKFI